MGKIFAMGGVCGQSICYHVVAFELRLNLMCNMTMFRKKLNIDRGSDTGI